MYHNLASPYSYSDCAITHQKPVYLVEAEEQVQEVTKRIQEFAHQLECATVTPSTLFYAQLAEAQDELDVAEHKRLKLSRYWHETGNEELPIPFDAASERLYRHLVSEVL
jgi:predicted ATPase